MNKHQAVENTNRELWRERPGDFYSDSIFVTENGSIGMNCGGTVAVMPIRQWYACMRECFPKPAAWLSSIDAALPEAGK